jgi:hypothetical protein
MRDDLSIPSTLGDVRPPPRTTDLQRLRRQLRAQGLDVVVERCPECHGVTTRETCTVLREGDALQRVTWRCHRPPTHCYALCPPRQVDTQPGEDPAMPPIQPATPRPCADAGCSTLVTGRSQFCSPACRQRTWRARQAAQPPIHRLSPAPADPPPAPAPPGVLGTEIPDALTEVVVHVERILALPPRARTALVHLVALAEGQ